MKAPHPVWDWRETPAQIDWSDMTKSKKISENSSAKVAAEAVAGIRNGTIRGLSQKADAQIARGPHGGAYGRAWPSLHAPRVRTPAVPDESPQETKA